MEQRTLDRLGSAAGVPAAILSPLGFGLIASQGFGGDLTRRDVADAMSEASASVVRSGAVIDVLGAAFMLVFAARMYVLLRQAEGSNGWLSVLAAFGLLAGVIGSFVDKAAYLALGSYLGGEEVDAAEAVTLLHLSSGAFQAVQLFIGGLFVGGVALVSLRTGALPRLLGWFSAVVALANIVAVAFPPDTASGVFALFIIWVLATSGYLTVVGPARSPRTAEG
jgi:hypothetical protein